MEKTSSLPLICEFKRFFFLPLKKVQMSQELIQYGEKTIYCHEVTGIRYGVMRVYVNGIKSQTIYEVSIKDQKNKKIIIRYVSALLTSKKTKTEKENLYLKLSSALWEAVGSQMLKNFLTQLTSGQSVHIGPCEVTRKGLNLTYWRWFKKRTDFIPWGQCLKASSNGCLEIWSKENKKIKVSLKYLSVWNAVVLQSLLDFLWEDGRAYQLQQL